MKSRFTALPVILAATLFATACDAGGSAEGIPDKFEIAWRLEKDGQQLSSGRSTCELHKKSPCEFSITEPVLTHVPFAEPVPQTETHGAFFISLVPPHIRQRNPQWPKGMVAVHETGDRAFNRFYAVLKEPGVVDAKTASKGQWDPVGHTYMPWARFAKGFEFDIPLAWSADPVSKKQLTNRGTGRVVITVAVGK